MARHLARSAFDQVMVSETAQHGEACRLHQGKNLVVVTIVKPDEPTSSRRLYELTKEEEWEVNFFV